MERKLKVGDSFEVVTCIGNKESPHAESVKGLTGIIIENESLFHSVVVNRLYGVNYGALLLPDEKPIFLSDFDTTEDFMKQFPKEFGNELFIKYLDQARGLIKNKKPLAFE